MTSLAAAVRMAVRRRRITTARRRERRRVKRAATESLTAAAAVAAFAGMLFGAVPSGTAAVLSLQRLGSGSSSNATLEGPTSWCQSVLEAAACAVFVGAAGMVVGHGMDGGGRTGHVWGIRVEGSAWGLGTLGLGLWWVNLGCSTGVATYIPALLICICKIDAAVLSAG